ncbi:MAG: DUF520 family protein, partial [Gammaproteobacteria bacterium]|nr:DUF520 family protein [Gammaproteobacteria bacterium]
MPSFDVVSEVDMHELNNSIDQTQREIGTRYDFKGTSAAIEQKENIITITGDSDFQLDQVRDVLYQKMVKRGVDIASLETGKTETSGKGVKQDVTIKQGIDKEQAKKLVKLIK